MISKLPKKIIDMVFVPDEKQQQQFLSKALLTISISLLVISWYYYRRITEKSNKRFPLPPGPRGLPLVGNLPFLNLDLCNCFAELARTHGPIIKLQLGHKLCIVLSSPSAAKEVLKDHDLTFANRCMTASGLVLTYGGLGVASAPYSPQWCELRKVLTQGMMSNASLESFLAIRRREVRMTVSDVNAKIGTPINIGEQMFVTTVNVITSMLWGGTLKGEERTSVGSEFWHVVEKSAELLAKPNVSDFFPALARFDLQGLQRQMEKCATLFNRIFDSVIDQRLRITGTNVKEGLGGRKDFLEFFLQLKESGEFKTDLTITHLKALFMDMMIAGTDTTPVMLEWAMAEILQHPEVMGRIQEELDQVVGPNNILEESHLPKLAYLNATLKEVLRLHPVLPLLSPRQSSQPCIVGGYMVPKGALVLVNVLAIQTDPDLWDHPLEFRPERFLTGNKKMDYSGTDFTYLPFGSGRRMCVGIPLAERILIYMIASLLHSFEWRLPVGRHVDLSVKAGAVLKKATPLIAIPTPRLSNSKLYL